MNKYQEALNNLVKESCPKKTFCKECGFEKTCNCDAKQDINTLQELIDNSPLKFEELKEDMWVWDGKTKSYIYILKPLEWEPVRGIRYASHIITNSAEGYCMDFEENRFYRREVQDEH